MAIDVELVGNWWSEYNA